MGAGSPEPDLQRSRKQFAERLVGMEVVQMVTSRAMVVLFLGAMLAAGAPLALAADSASVELKPQNSSGESGTATLTKAGADKTKVVVELKGEASGATHPMHIHKGTCANLDPKPAYPLSPVKNGKSETMVNASLDSLQKGEYAINGHKSAQDIATNVFCGDIGKM